MAIKRNAIDLIRKNIENSIGKKVRLKANRGRKKVIEAQGVIEKTYPKLFVVRLNSESPVKRMSYTYVDVLTETVELVIEEDRLSVATL